MRFAATTIPEVGHRSFDSISFATRFWLPDAVRLPRDISGDDLAKALSVLGYRVTRQTGSHMRLTTLEPGEHHLTVPRHNPLRVGTLNGILTDVATHLQVTRDELAQRLFG
jgi:predicted RNA binding protein YcfA (HicA-like mRNA interferase family)